MTSFLIVKIILCVLAFLASLFCIALFIDSVVMDFMPKKIQDKWEHYF
jgi:hypothetical protein